MIGETLSHFEILELIGQGGFGEVYRARDTELDRSVALKLLPEAFCEDPAQRSRFRREAQAASRVSHPNVCTIYEFGEEGRRAFIAMELVEGRTLKERIAASTVHPDEALGFAIQIAEGLAAAHRKSVVHRDIKSANIVLTSGGEVKILDFGLAKWVYHQQTPGAAEAPTVVSDITSQGTTLGTIGYMSPEQLLGREVDQRTDQFAFGVVCYEMLSGRLPFEGATVFETSNAILNADPPPLMSVAPRVPAELARLVDRLLSKEPGGRFETSDELLAELRKVRRPGESAEWPISGDASERPSMGGALERLSADAVSGRKIIRDASGASDSAPVPPVSRSGSRRWAASGSGRWTAAAGPQGPSIAVLPLASLSSDVENEYFSEGLSEDLINALARIPGLNVASRTSAFFFKDKKMDIREIASILGVETLLEGSVRKVGDRIRVTVQLVNAVDGYHIWSESYDRHLEDIFAIQDDISRTIAETLEVTLLGPRDQPLVRRHTQDIEAYKLYLQGRYHWNRRYRGGMQTAIRCFREAMEKDPAFALPYSGLADSLAILAFYNYLPAQEGFPKAKAAAQAALQIDDTNAEAHGSLGFVTSFYDWDWEAGDAEFVRALELKPDYGTGHWWYASALMVRGRGEDSDRELRLALEAEPLSAIISGGASFHLYFRREYDKGADRARRSLELDPDFGPSHAFLAWNYMELGRYDEALPEWQRAIELLEGLPLVRAMLGINLARSGDEEGAGEILAELTADEAASRAVYPYHLAILSAALRQKDAAFEWLEYAYETRNNWLAFLRIDPSIDPLRGDPRLDDLIGRVGLPED